MSKYTMEIITAHNGSEVISIISTSYTHTKFDKIMADWRLQENRRRAEEKKKKGKIINLLLRRKTA